MVLSFREALESCLTGIPRGRVATCGAIARALGDVRAARSVATWLADHGDTPGAHRVVRPDGRPIMQGAAEFLGREGLVLHEGRAPGERFVDAIPAVPLLEALRAQQLRLASRVSEEDEASAPQTYGGVDVAYEGDRAFGVAVSLDANTLETIEVCEREVEVDFPYIPTYLAFRELPGIQAALKGLRKKPDLLFVDGHGRLHPARFGFACFAGVELDVPTIGIAKHPLTGRPAPSRGPVLGATPIEIDGTLQGFAWTPPGTSGPFYVSVGHRISLRTALDTAQRATRRRYPEPLLVADRLSKEGKIRKTGKEVRQGAAVRRLPAQGREGL